MGGFKSALDKAKKQLKTHLHGRPVGGRVKSEDQRTPRAPERQAGNPIPPVVRVDRQLGLVVSHPFPHLDQVLALPRASPG